MKTSIRPVISYTYQLPVTTYVYQIKLKYYTAKFSRCRRILELSPKISRKIRLNKLVAVFDVGVEMSWLALQNDVCIKKMSKTTKMMEFSLFQLLQTLIASML